MDFLKKLVSGKKKTETWTRSRKTVEPSSFRRTLTMKNQRQTSLSKYQLMGSISKNDFSGSWNHVERRNQPGTRSLTPNPLDSISRTLTQLKKNAPKANSSIIKNMGYGQHKISSIRILKKASKNKIGSSVRNSDFQTNNDYEDRLQEETFIKIPKVKCEYKKKSVRDKFRKFKRKGTQKQSRQNEKMYNSQVQINSARATQKSEQMEVPLSSASIIKNSSRVSSQISRIWNSQSKPPKESRAPEFGQKETSELSGDLKLDFDMFSQKQSGLVSSTMLPNSASFRTSQLSKRILMSSELFSKPVADQNQHLKSMFDLKTQMQSRRESVQKAPQEQAKVARVQRSRPRETGSSTRSRILATQKRQIKIAELNIEINNFLKQTPKKYTDSVLELNRNLQKLEKEFLSLNHSNQKIKTLLQNIKILNLEIEKKNLEINELKYKNKPKKNKKVEEFEENLSEADLKERKSKIKILKKVEKKVQKYQKQLENLDEEMWSRSQNILETKSNTIENELESLKLRLEEDLQNEFLIEQMTKLSHSFKIL